MTRPRSLALLAALPLCAAAPRAQSEDLILHYKMEVGAGSRAINHAPPRAGIPRFASFEPPSMIAAAWGPGRFGAHGLAAAPSSPNSGVELVTGWDNFVGDGQDVTLAFFLRTVHPMPSNDTTLLCGPSGSGDGIELYIRGDNGYVSVSWPTWSSGSVGVGLAEDVLALANAGWVHLAVTIDRSDDDPCDPSTVRWFIDGVPRPAGQVDDCLRNILGTAQWPFVFADRSEDHFEFDEMRVALEVVPDATIAAWASQDLASGAPIGEACHPFGTLALLDGSSGGFASLGNDGHALRTYSLPGTGVGLALGGSLLDWAGTPLPYDLGALVGGLAGCQLWTSADLVWLGLVGPNGAYEQALPIPADPLLVGRALYAQAVLYSPILKQDMLTNAYAISIGE